MNMTSRGRPASCSARETSRPETASFRRNSGARVPSGSMSEAVRTIVKDLSPPTALQSELVDEADSAARGGKVERARRHRGRCAGVLLVVLLPRVVVGGRVRPDVHLARDF